MTSQSVINTRPNTARNSLNVGAGGSFFQGGQKPKFIDKTDVLP